MNLLQVEHKLSPEKLIQLHQQLFYENSMRSKLFAKIVIVFESILLIRNFVLADSPINTYSVMYMTLLVLAIGMLLFITTYEKRLIYEERRATSYQIGLHILVSIFLLWGSVLTLIDQAHYGQVMAFVVNAMCVSILFNIHKGVFLQLFAVPVAVLFIGLPFFQPSSDVVVGHIINLTVFLFFCWLASKIIYTSYYRNFYNKVLLEQSNEQLEMQIVENKSINIQLQQAIEQLKEISVSDELSKIPNRRGFFEHIQLRLDTLKQPEKISIIMMDIDAFKLYNDNYGHVEGNHIIYKVAQVIQQCIDLQTSIAARYGGEEFIVAAINKSDNEIYETAERIRQAIEDLQIPHAYSPVSNVVTFSLGIATCKIANHQDLKQLIEHADQILYKAKQNGRNQVALSFEQVVYT